MLREWWLLGKKLSEVTSLCAYDFLIMSSRLALAKPGFGFLHQKEVKAFLNKKGGRR